MASHASQFVMSSGTPVRLPYRARSVYELPGMTVVLLDPDDYLKDAQYVAERRAGRAPLKNLRAFAPDGRLLWSAEFPDESDYYAEVESTSPLVALSYSGFRCTIDQSDGRIVEQEFLK